MVKHRFSLKTFKTLLVFGAVLSSGLTACVTSSSDSAAKASSQTGAAEVIERSQAQPPQWIELPAKQLLEDEKSYTYVDVRRQQLDLPLGLKETQLEALAGSELALRQQMRSMVLSTAADSGISLTAPTPDQAWEQMIATATQEVHGANAHITDLYFEKLHDRGAEPPHDYYDLYVVIQFPRSARVALLSQIANQLARSRDDQLKSLGLALERQTATTH